MLGSPTAVCLTACGLSPRPAWWNAVHCPAAGALPCRCQPSAHSPACRCAPQDRQTLEEAEQLLKKMGFTGSLFQGAPPPQEEEEEEEEDDDDEE